jgi:hypothetical protein
MASARSEVHILTCHLPVFQPCIDDCHGLMQVNDRYFNQVLNEHLPEFLSNGKVLVHWVKKVLDLLLVYLIEGYMNAPVK